MTTIPFSIKKVELLACRQATVIEEYSLICPQLDIFIRAKTPLAALYRFGNALKKVKKATLERILE